MRVIGKTFLGSVMLGLKRIENKLPEEKRNKIFKIVLELPDLYSLENMSFYSVGCFVRTKPSKFLLSVMSLF